MSATLNRERPYAEVYGTPGVKFQQSGRYFRQDGALVNGNPDRDREMREIKQALANPDTTPEAAEALRDRLEVIKVDAAPAPEPEDAGEQSDDQLKALLKTYGEPWTGRKAALRFLERGRA